MLLQCPLTEVQKRNKMKIYSSMKYYTISVVKYLNIQVLKYYSNTTTGI